MFPVEAEFEPRARSRTYSSGEVCRISGASLRQLQWWDERGVVSAPRKHRRRSYNVAEVLEVLIVTELRRKDLSLERVRKVMRSFRPKLHKSGDSGWDGNSPLYLLTDGISVNLADRPERAVAEMAGAKRFMALVSLDDQMRRIGKYEEAKRDAGNQMDLF